MFLYAVLRCIPDKLFGVIGLVGGLLLIMLLFLSSGGFVLRYWMVLVILLTWLGRLDILEHYVNASQLLSGLYFVVPVL